MKTEIKIGTEFCDEFGVLYTVLDHKIFWSEMVNDFVVSFTILVVDGDKIILPAKALNKSIIDGTIKITNK